jgi:hypothetical protein
MHWFGFAEAGCHGRFSFHGAGQKSTSCRQWDVAIEPDRSVKLSQTPAHQGASPLDAAFTLEAG